MNVHEMRHTLTGQTYNVVMDLRTASDAAVVAHAATSLREHLLRRGLRFDRLSDDALLDLVFRTLAGDS